MGQMSSSEITGAETEKRTAATARNWSPEGTFLPRINQGRKEQAVVQIKRYKLSVIYITSLVDNKHEAEMNGTLR